MSIEKKHLTNQTLKLYVTPHPHGLKKTAGLFSVPTYHTARLDPHGQLRQRHVADGIDAVIVRILRLVRHVPVTILVPLV